MADIKRKVKLRWESDAKQLLADFAKIKKEAAAARDAVSGQAQAAAGAAQSTQQSTQANKQQVGGLQQLNAALGVVTKGYAIVTTAIQKAQAVGQQFYQSFILSNEELQKGLVETAAGIASTNTVFDGAGNEIDDATASIQRLLPGLERAREEVVQLANGIPGVTESDIQPIFNQLAQSVGQLQVGIEEVPALAANATAALKTFNIPLFQARQEINALLRGQIDRNAALANQLGIQKQDIELAKQQNRLYEFLNETFAEAAAGAGLLAGQTDNSLSNIQTTISRITRELGKPILEPVQEGLKFVADFIAGLEEPILNLYAQIREGAADLFGPAIERARAAFRALQPSFDRAVEFFNAARTQLGNILQSVGRIISAIVDSGAIEYLFEQANRIFAVLLTIGTFLTNVIGGALTTVGDNIATAASLLKPIVALARTLLTIVDNLTKGAIVFFQALGELPGIRQILGFINTDLEKANLTFKAIGATIRETNEVLANWLSLGRRQREQAERQRRAQDQLADRIRAASDAQREGIALTREEFIELQKEIRNVFDDETANQIITGLIERNRAIAEAAEQTQLQIQSNEERERQEALERLNLFQDELDLFSEKREFQDDAKDAIAEETKELERQLELQRGGLRIQQALANLAQQRGQAELELLGRESERIQANLERLQEEGGSNRQIRREERRLEAVREREFEQRIEQIQLEAALKDAQLRSQEAEIESQRQLNQLKVDQLEIDTELARLAQEEKLAGLENQLDTQRREGGDPEKIRELERSINETNAEINDLKGREEEAANRRAQIDATAEQQRVALGIQREANQEALVNDVIRAGVESGQEEFTDIDDNRRLSLADRGERLREQATETLGQATVESAATVSTAAGTTTASGEVASDPALVTVNRQLTQILQAIPEPQQIGAAVSQRENLDISNPEPPTSGGLSFDRTLESVGS